MTSVALSRPQRHPGLVLGVLLSAIVMAQFDFFVVNVAAPTIDARLHASDGALQLVVGGYAFAYAAGMITAGRLGDLFGHRRLFVGGVAAFTVASGLCGLAATPTELIAARLAQGLGAAAMVPQILALINTAFEERDRPRAMGWYGAAAGVGSILGQVLGGLLLEADLAGLGWRAVFLVNVPIGVVAVALAHRVLPEARPQQRTALDVPGALGAAAAIGLVLVPLAFGHEEGWPTWTWLSIAGAVVAGAATGRWQQALSARGGSPVLELSLLREPGWVAGVAANAAFMASFASLMFALTLLLQPGFGLDAIHAGLVFLPMGLAFVATSLAARHIVGRYGVRTLAAGSVLTAAGLAMMTAALAEPDVAAGWLIPGLALTGAGNGVVLPSLIGATLAKVDPTHAGAAAGTLTTVGQFAGALGVAGVGSVFFAALGGSPTRAAYQSAMQEALAVDIALVVLVIVALGVLARTDRAQRPAPPDLIAGDRLATAKRPS